MRDGSGRALDDSWPADGREAGSTKLKVNRCERRYLWFAGDFLWRGECVCGVASVAQLGERQTEDLKVPGSIPGRGTFSRSSVFLLHT